jgi:phosphatidylglycerophosphatase C
VPLNPPPVVAAFDFDGTLTKRDTLLPYLVQALGWPRFLWALLVCAPWLLAYALRLLPNHVAKQRLLAASLKGRAIDEVERWTTRWCAASLEHSLQDWAMAQLAQHRQARHHCVLVSASPDIYLKRVALKLGFDALICTELEVKDGHLTGAMRTPNCYGEQKAIRLRAHLAREFGQAAAQTCVVHAYGDSAGDRDLLSMARYAWYRGKPWVRPPGI